MNLFRNKTTLAVLIVFLGGFFYFIFKFYQPTSKTMNDNGIVRRNDLIQRTTIAGTVVPLRKTVITAPYNGYIKKIYVKIGDSVKQGDPLVAISQSLQSQDNVFPIRAPFDGVVVQILKSEGEFVKEGDSNSFILRVDNLDKLFIFSNTPEIDRTKIKINQEAIIRVSAILNRTYKGIITELSLAAIEKESWAGRETVEFPMKIEILDPDDAIKVGMSVIIDIITEKKESVLTIGHEYLFRKNNQAFVTLISGKKQNIQTGLQNEDFIEVVEGLNEGDQVTKVDFTKLNSVE